MIFELIFNEVEVEVHFSIQLSFLPYTAFAPLTKIKQTKVGVPTLILDREDFKARKVSEIKNSITQ